MARRDDCVASAQGASAASIKLPLTHVPSSAHSRKAVIGLCLGRDTQLAGRAGCWNLAATAVILGRVELKARITGSRARAQTCGCVLCLSRGTRVGASAGAVSSLFVASICAVNTDTFASRLVLDLVLTRARVGSRAATGAVLSFDRLMVGIGARGALAATVRKAGTDPIDGGVSSLYRAEDTLTLAA